MIQLFINTHDDVLKAVKRESSYIGERTFNEQGESMLDELVYDEEYLIQFRAHFLTARSKVIMATLAYSKNIETDPSFFETHNVDMEKDFVIFLDTPSNHPRQALQPLIVSMKDFIVNYILYLWLENKLPREAQAFLNRSEGDLADIKRGLEMKIKPYRRIGRMF